MAQHVFFFWEETRECMKWWESSATWEWRNYGLEHQMCLTESGGNKNYFCFCLFWENWWNFGQSPKASDKSNLKGDTAYESHDNTV